MKASEYLLANGYEIEFENEYQVYWTKLFMGDKNKVIEYNVRHWKKQGTTEFRSWENRRRLRSELSLFNPEYEEECNVMNLEW